MDLVSANELVVLFPWYPAARETSLSAEATLPELEREVLQRRKLMDTTTAAAVTAITTTTTDADNDNTATYC